MIECRKKIRSRERGTGYENVETADGREGIVNVPIVTYRSSGDNAEDIFLLQVRSALAKPSTVYGKKILTSTLR